MDLSAMVLKAPEIDYVPYNLRLNVYKAENLPVKDYGVSLSHLVSSMKIYLPYVSQFYC